jgi:hypothetical protein
LTSRLLRLHGGLGFFSANAGAIPTDAGPERHRRRSDAIGRITTIPSTTKRPRNSSNMAIVSLCLRGIAANGAEHRQTDPSTCAIEMAGPTKDLDLDLGTTWEQ